MQHPSKNITKEYIVTYAKDPTRVQLEALAMGCEIDGVLVQPVSISYAAPDRKDKLRLTVSEGRNREVSCSEMIQKPFRCSENLAGISHSIEQQSIIRPQ